MTQLLSTFVLALTLVCLSLAIQAQADSLTDARATGRGGTGVALATPHTVLLNPANAMEHSGTAFAANFGFGVRAADPGNVIDKVDDANTDIQHLSDYINGLQQEFETAKTQFESLQTNLNNHTLADGTYTIDDTTFTVKNSGTQVVVNGKTESASTFIQNQKTYYKNKLTEAKNATQGKIDTVVDDLDSMSDEPISIAFGTAFVATVPTDTIGVSLFAKAHAKMAGSFHFAASDKALLENAKANSNMDKTQIQSYLQASVLGITSYGINLANNFDFGIGTLDYGVALKSQKFYLANKKIAAGSNDGASAAFDRDKDMFVSGSKINADLGVTQYFTGTGLSVGAVIHNALPYSVELPNKTATYHVKPQLTLGAAWNIGWFKAAIDLDTLKNHGFGSIKPTQNLRIGLQFGYSYAAQFRLGYVDDLQGNDGTVYTLGVGLSPFDTLSIDLAGIIGHGKNYGLMLTLGVDI